jgi:hypothetical protein
MEQIYLEPKIFVSTNKGIIRAEWLNSNLIIKNINNGNQKILYVEKEEISVKEITLINNQKISFYLHNFIDTFDGFKEVSEIKEGDLIKQALFSSFNPQHSIIIDWENVFKTNALKVKIPTILSEDFAYWLGLVSAGAKFTTNDLTFEIQKGKEISGDIFRELTKKIFDLTPVSFKDKNNREYYTIPSQNLVKFLKINIGKSKKFRKVPKFILESSIACQVKFIEGLSLNGNSKTRKKYIFSSMSLLLINYVSCFMKTIGYQTYIKNNISSNNKKVMYVMVNSKHKEAPLISTPFCDLSNLSDSFIVKVPSLLKYVKVNKVNKSYNTIRKIIKTNQKFCQNKVLSDINVRYNDYFTFSEVKEVKIIKKEMIKVFCRTLDGVICESLILKN